MSLLRRVWNSCGNDYMGLCKGAQSSCPLREGQSVMFDATEGPKGPRAENVRLA
jgi:'Cold-shock' DNA-binding domain